MGSDLIPPLYPERPDFSYVWKAAGEYDGAKERKVQSLSAAMDVDEDIVRNNLPDYESYFASRQLYSDTVARSYPTVYRNLSSIPFVAVARDDMGNIIETEGWWNEISNAYNVARDTVAIGNIGTRAMLEGRDLYPYERRKIERARQLQRAHMRSEPGLVAASAELLGTMQETLGYSLAAGAAAGAVFPPAAPFVSGGVAFATSYNLEAGNLYADLVMDGYTPAQAAEIGATYGAVIAGFEALGLKGAGAGLKALGREALKGKASDFLKKQTAGEAFKQIILKDYALKGIGGESLTEGVQEVLSELGKRRASELYRPDNLYEPEYLETFGQAAWHTAKGMVLLGGLPAGGRLAIENMRAAESFHAEREAVRAAENYAKSKAPEAAEQVSREAGETLPDDKYYIRAQGFMETVRDIERQEREQGRPEGGFRRTLEEYQPGLLEKLEEAAARDGDVELSKTDFDKVFSQTEAFKAAFQHVAHREDGMTVREREEFMGIREKMTKDMEEEQKDELQKMEEVEDELVEIRQAVRAAVEPVIGEEAAKGMDVAANMTVLTSFITRAAAVQGISPKEFVERYMPEIQQRVLGEEAAQAAPVIEVVEAAPEMSEAMTEADEAPVTRVTPVVASAATENPQRQAVEPEPAAEPEVEAAPEVEPEVAEEAAPAPEPAAEPETDEAQLFEGDATPEQVAKFLSLLPPRNAQGLFDLSNEKRLPRTGRFVKMQEALMAMDRGEITREQRDALADILKPVLADDQIYDAPTNEEMSNALKPKQVALLNQKLEAGRRVGVRLDIPSTKKGARTIAVHDVGAKSKKAKGYQRGGKEVSYTNVARLSNAEMVMHQETAKGVALGENKDKLGVIYGDWMPTSVKEATKIAQEALTDPAWRQVGIDPERHGYYYDRKTGEPLVSADEVVQVGSQVFAKNAKVAGKEQFLYSKEGEAPRARIELVMQIWEGDTFEKGWKDQYGRNAENDEYVYHVTTPERAQAILESGELSPGQQQSMDEGFYKGYSAGKVFLAEKSGVDFWASTVREHLQAQQDEEVGRLVLLRVPWDEVKDQLENDEVGERDSKAGSYFSTKPIRLYRGKPTPRKKMKVDTLLRLATGRSIENVKEAYELLGKGMRPGGKFGPEFSQGVRSLLSGQIAFDEVYGDALSDAPYEALKIAFERQGLDPNLVDLDAAMYDPSTPGPYISTIEAVQEQLSQEFNQYETAKFLFGVAKTLDELAPTEGGYSRVNQVLDSIARVFGEDYDTALEGDTVLLYSKEGEQRRVLGQAEVDGGNAIKKILLDPNAKPTTLMHELMHWNLELMSDMSLNIEQKEEAQRNALEKQVLKDTTALLEWAGYKGTLEGWRQMDLDARRPFHEAIAASFELFLYKGEAPSRQLRGIFQRLLNYINESYKQIVQRFQKEYQDEFKRPLPALNDDVRAIFGRMMSAERDTMDFFDQYDMTARLVTREQWVEAGRDPKDYDEYDRDFKDAIAEAQAELTQRRMEEVGWQGRARERTGAKIREERRRTEAKAREDIDAEVRETQIFQLQSYIYNGYYRTEENPQQTAGEFPSTRLSYEAVAAIDEEMAKALSQRGLLKKGDGMPLNVARKMFGFESNEDMLQQLSESRSINDEVEYRLDRYMIEEQSGLTDPVLVEERIQAAIHNRMRERVIGLELRYILNNGRNTKQELANAREMARDIIGRTPTGDINLTAYNRAAARARKKALKALKDGDMEAAAFAKRQELLNEALIREGGKAREEVRKLVNANKRVFRHRSDKALAKAGYDVVIVKGLRALLSRLGIGGAVQDDPSAATDAMRQKHPQFAKEMESEIEYFLGLDLPPAQVGDRRKQMERLTLADAKRLRTLMNIWLKRAKDDRSAVLQGKKQNIEAAQESLLTRISRISAKDRAINEKEHGWWSKIRDFASDLIRFEQLFRRIDGGETGPWTSVFRTIKDAANNLRVAFKGFLDFFQDGLEGLDLKIPGGERMITAEIPGARKPVVFGSGNTAAKLEMMHFAMHFYGNASNRERLVAGLTAPDGDRAAVEAGINRFLQSQIDQGVLTLKDFQFMQSLFDKLADDGLFQKAQEVMYRTRGYEMEAVEPTPFPITFPNGKTVKFDGGYIPVRYDSTETGGTTTEATLEEGQISPEQQHMRAMEYLPSFTKNRVKDVQNGRALLLDLRQVLHHAHEVYRFIHMTEPGTDAYKIINGLDGNSPVKAAFVARFGNKAYENLLAWLKRSTYQATEREALAAGQTLNALARNANMGVMFLNVGNSLQNYSGLTIPMRRLGFSRVAGSFIRTLFNPSIRRDIIGKSKEMAIRLNRQVFDILQSQRKIVTSQDSAWARIQDWTSKHAYILQQITQNHVDVAVWQAAYNKRVQELGGGIESEAEAVAYADSEVRRTQMAGEREDLSLFESQGGMIRAFFPFKSWFINWGNTTYAQAQIDVEQTEVNKYAALASTYFYALMVPAVLASAATMIARGTLGEQFEDDDDDGYGDEAFVFWARSQLDQVFGGIPVADRGWQMIANNWFDDEYWNNRFPILPWQRAYESVIRGTTKLGDDPLAGGVELSAEIATMLGVPAVGAFRRMSLIGDEIAGELESESTYDFLRGAVTGQRSDLQRLSQ